MSGCYCVLECVNLSIWMGWISSWCKLIKCVVVVCWYFINAFIVEMKRIWKLLFVINNCLWHMCQPNIHSIWCHCKIRSCSSSNKILFSKINAVRSPHLSPFWDHGQNTLHDSIQHLPLLMAFCILSPFKIS